MSKVTSLVWGTLVLLSIFFLGKAGANENSIEEKPNWITDPYTKCEKIRELCGVGEGTGPAMAKANARREISLVFETKITGSKSFSKSSRQKGGSDSVEGDSIESSYSEVKEITESVLNGIEILATYNGRENVYALAVLDKRKSASAFMEEMNKIDQQMDILIKDKSKVNTKKLRRLSKIRSEINSKYQIVKGQFYPEKYSAKDFAGDEGVTKKIQVFINIAEKDSLFPLKGFFSSLLTENDYLVAIKKDDGALFTLEGELNSEEMFLKVEGFKRYKFNLNLSFVNKSGKKVKTLQNVFIQDGRNIEDIQDKVLKEIRDYLKKEWGEITIE